MSREEEGVVCIGSKPGGSQCFTKHPRGAAWQTTKEFGYQRGKNGNGAERRGWGEGREEEKEEENDEGGQLEKRGTEET